MIFYEPWQRDAFTVFLSEKVRLTLTKVVIFFNRNGDGNMVMVIRDVASILKGDSHWVDDASAQGARNFYGGPGARHFMHFVGRLCRILKVRERHI